jgi:hypothetical protein
VEGESVHITLEKRCHRVAGAAKHLLNRCADRRTDPSARATWCRTCRAEATSFLKFSFR